MPGPDSRSAAARHWLLALAICCLTAVAVARSQVVDMSPSSFQAISVSMDSQRIASRKALRVIKSPAVTAFDQPTFARLHGDRFHNGTIEVKVLSRLLDDAPELARGFIGVAFRINEDQSKFECIYIRPQNAMVDNQLRRNRATQYFSFPDFDFERLRKEAPGQYESYAPVALGEWIDLRIEVQGATARLYIGRQRQPVLVVTDLKHGPDAAGAIGLWVDVGSEAYFSDLRIRHDR